jgi:lysophospholipase L1-like esterase
MRSGTALAASVLALLMMTPAGAQEGQPPVRPAPVLTLSQPELGWIRAQVSGAPGTTVLVSEPGGTPVAVALGADGRGGRKRLAPWRCDARRRTFTATQTVDGVAQTASESVSTPSCRGRLELLVSAPAVRAGRTVTVGMRDRWGVGAIRASVCRAGPQAGRAACRGLTLAAGRARATYRFRPAQVGRWRVELRRPGEVRRRPLHVRPAGDTLRLLATGDSMIQYVDTHLERQLGGARGQATVESDAHISTGISSPFLLDWPDHAAASARRFHPEATVVFLGANDGFVMRTPAGRQVACCAAAWSAEYARRAGRMMRSYARAGAGTSYWLLLPAPRKPALRTVFAAVNAGIRRAAHALPGTVRVVDLGPVFTPGDRFRQTMRWHGRQVDVRQADGVHLSFAGAAIAAEVVVRALRGDGLVR